MRAVVLKEPGGPEKLELTEVAKPQPGRGEVLVRIHASALNPVDAKIREGLPIGPALPAILGADLAGVVEAVGDGVDGLKPGDEVFGCAGGVRGHGGTLAQYIAADARLVARKPTSLAFREAAALPLVSITAWEGLEKLNLSEGSHLLVQGGAGGVGHVAIQLAKARGATVTATSRSQAGADVARGLGADNAVVFADGASYDAFDRVTDGKGFDAVFDTIGGANLVHSFKAAATGGRVATINARAVVDLGDMHAKALSLHVVFMLLPMLTGVGRERHGEILRQIARLADDGLLRPLLDPRTFGLAEAADAHRHMASGAARGKIVVDIA